MKRLIACILLLLTLMGLIACAAREEDEDRDEGRKSTRKDGETTLGAALGAQWTDAEDEIAPARSDENAEAEKRDGGKNGLQSLFGNGDEAAQTAADPYAGYEDEESRTAAILASVGPDAAEVTILEKTTTRSMGYVAQVKIVLPNYTMMFMEAAKAEDPTAALVDIVLSGKYKESLNKSHPC